MWLIYIVSAMPQPIPTKVEIPFFDTVLHIVEYAFLGYLLARAFFNSNLRINISILRILAVVIASIYGFSDEIHQSFVPTRDASPLDWIFDNIGAFIGVWFKITK